MGIPLHRLPDRVQKQILAQSGEPLAKPHKYHMKGNGRSSGAELTYGEVLEARQFAGEIRDLRRQVRVNLPGLTMYMVVDFAYYDVRLECQVWDEFKGFPTREWLQKKSLWAAGFGPGILRVTKRVRGGGYEHTDIHPTPRRKLIAALEGEAPC
jgi:hypothetical protein